MPTTRSRPAREPVNVESVLQRLDAAMMLWARRQQEPTALVERSLDDLWQVWAAARMDLGDDLGTTTRSSPAKSRRSVARTATARSRKTSDDELRERYIVKRYAVHVRRTANPRAAREAVAEEVRKGLYLPRYCPSDWQFYAPYTATYSEKSVRRVLKKYAAR